MKPLTPFQNFIFQAGGVLLVLGILCPLFPFLSRYTLYVLTSGVLMYATMQLQQRYEGSNLVIRRLRRQQILSSFLLLISACLLLAESFALLPLVVGSWKAILAIAAFLQLYTAFRLPVELSREKEGKND